MEGLTFPFPELSWLCVGVTTSAITCNPLLNFCLILPMYILYHGKHAPDAFLHLMGLFAGVGMGLWLRKRERWTPYWDGDYNFLVLHLLIYAVGAYVVRHFVFLLLTVSVSVTLMGERFAKIVTLQSALLFLWKAWSLYFPHNFEPFYRLYALCVIAMILLISDSVQQEKK